ncbi:hypothetical protein [Spiroplasma endosymbiont of Megaselia nigra]|uniref:hypothetical protein n=1 Tax=Spiroplasma endosymbiont of Megaselia nigra TaxID=2478537 RepID=UPI000F878A83|nr:hypothetical protein [Spiroplasma endosymbiont of Megaselia nigra]RUO86685.1 hypothetical protein D9R21_01570 [Spiroplasma endosymbiont of Megaselia nigra]
MKKLNSSKKYSIIEIQEELESYHSIPVYFFQHNFASLDIENLKSKKIDAKSIIEWIKLNIFDQDIENILKFEKANILTNNSVHKNHYDKEGFKGWYINENELDILYKTLQIYMEILFNTLKLEKEKIWQIKQK